MDLKLKLKEIEEHFLNLSQEDFDKNLEISGAGKITSSFEEDMILLPSQSISYSPLQEYMGYQNYVLGDAA